MRRAALIILAAAALAWEDGGEVRRSRLVTALRLEEVFPAVGVNYLYAGRVAVGLFAAAGNRDFVLADNERDLGKLKLKLDDDARRHVHRAAAAAGLNAGAIMAQGAFEVLFNVSFGFMFAWLALFGYATMRLVAAKDNRG